MKLQIIALVALGLVATSHRAVAQGQDQFAFGIAGGVAIPVDNLKLHHTNGVNGTGSLAIGAVDSPVGIRFDLMYNTFGDRVGGTATTDQGKARILALTGNAVFSIYGQGTRLYTIVGAGGYSYQPDGAGTEDETGFGLNAGFGLWIPRVSGFVEARFHNAYRMLPDQTDATKRRRSAQFFPITFGVLF